MSTPGSFQYFSAMIKKRVLKTCSTIPKQQWKIYRNNLANVPSFSLPSEKIRSDTVFNATNSQAFIYVKNYMSF
jgi:hypothetical protein